jgi:hypothetical protein
MTNEYGLSLTSTVPLLTSLGIRNPDEATPPEYPVKYKAGDGSIKADGFLFVIWKWDVLSRAGLWKIMALLAGARSISIYVRTKTFEGAGVTWRTYTGILEAPDLAGTDGTPIEQEVYGFKSVSIRISHLVAV